MSKWGLLEKRGKIMRQARVWNNNASTRLCLGDLMMFFTIISPRQMKRAKKLALFGFAPSKALIERAMK
jgi:hypothetical protein